MPYLMQLHKYKADCCTFQWTPPNLIHVWTYFSQTIQSTIVNEPEGVAIILHRQFTQALQVVVEFLIAFNVTYERSNTPGIGLVLI